MIDRNERVEISNELKQRDDSSSSSTTTTARATTLLVAAASALIEPTSQDAMPHGLTIGVVNNDIDSNEERTLQTGNCNGQSSDNLAMKQSSAAGLDRHKVSDQQLDIEDEQRDSLDKDKAKCNTETTNRAERAPPMIVNQQQVVLGGNHRRLVHSIEAEINDNEKANYKVNYQKNSTKMEDSDAILRPLVNSSEQSCKSSNFDKNSRREAVKVKQMPQLNNNNNNDQIAMEVSNSNDDEEDDGNGLGSDSERRYRPQKYCAVCGDKAIACNFNAVTCESCKAFFRRNAFKEQKLRCLFENRCVIDRVTRRFCSKCRLLKCLEIGMKREWILTDEQKQMKRVKIMQNKQTRQQQQQQQVAVTSDSHLEDDVIESRPSSGMSSNHGGTSNSVHNQHQTELALELPNIKAQLSIKSQRNRTVQQPVETQDASTSCPDETDFLNGHIRPYCSFVHQCQYCSFKLGSVSYQQQPAPAPPMRQASTNVNHQHHHYQQQNSFNYQQFQQHHQHEQQHQTHPSHHHYHYQQATHHNMQASLQVYNQQQHNHQLNGAPPASVSSAANAMNNCYNFGPSSSTTTSQLGHHQHGEPAPTMMHHQYHYHHQGVSNCNVMNVGASTHGTTLSCGSTGSNRVSSNNHQDCCCSSNHTQASPSQPASHRGPFQGNQGGQLAFATEPATGGGCHQGIQLAPPTGCQPDSTGQTPPMTHFNMIELLQARVHPMNGLSQDACSSSDNSSSIQQQMNPSGADVDNVSLDQNDGVILVDDEREVDLENVVNDLGESKDCSVIELEQESDDCGQPNSKTLAERDTCAAAAVAVPGQYIKNTGSSETLISNQVDGGDTTATNLEENRLTFVAENGFNNTPSAQVAHINSSPTRRFNYVTWESEMFVEPALTEQEIWPRLDKLDYSDSERRLIYEMIEATRLIFEPTERTSNDTSLDDLVYFCDMALRRLIKAVKKISAFRMLSMDDQIMLLKNACFKILLIRSSVHYLDECEGWRDKSGCTVQLKSIKTEKCNSYDRHKELLEKLTPPLRRDRLVMSFLVLVILFDPTVTLKHSNSVGLDNLVYLCALRKYLLSLQPDPLAKYERIVEALRLVNACNEEYNLFFSLKYQPEQITPLLIEIFDISLTDPLG